MPYLYLHFNICSKSLFLNNNNNDDNIFSLNIDKQYTVNEQINLINYHSSAHTMQ